MSATVNRSLETDREIGRINAFFPLLPRVGNKLAATRPWEGLTIALNLHLTTLTATLVREIVLGGGTFVISAASMATTDPAVVDYLREQGLAVHTGGDLENRHKQVMEHKPDYVVDVGFELIDHILAQRTKHDYVKGAVEFTKSGITRMRRHKKLPFPVININDGRLKEAIENRHGVGEAIWHSVARLTGIHLAGRRVAVIGYGPVGRGIAAHARAAGMTAEVVEQDAIRRLRAHYDGFPTPSLEDALSRVGLLITATGTSAVLTADHLKGARNGLILVNAGHGGNEINVKSIKKAAIKVDQIAENVVGYQLENGPSVTVLANGNPLNIVLNAGSPEPVLLHFTVATLALEGLVVSDLEAGESLVTNAIETQAAVMALQTIAGN
jgi:adenosylhomocysteinase